MNHNRHNIHRYVFVVCFCFSFTIFAALGCKSDYILCQRDEDCPVNMVCAERKYCIYSGDAELSADVKVNIDDTGVMECRRDEDCSGQGVCAEAKCNISKHICETVFKDSNFICRPSKSFCDIAEYCTGKSADCPYDPSYIFGEFGIAIVLNDTYKHAYEPKIASNGSEYAVVWYSNETSNCDMFVTRIKRYHDIMSTDSIISGGWWNCWMPSIIWNGKEYAVVWSDNREGLDNIYFVRLDAYGQKKGNEVKIAGNPNSNAYYPKILWDGSGYGVIWLDNREGDLNLYFVRIDNEGKRVTDEIKLSDKYSTNYYDRSSISYDGKDFMIFWTEQYGESREIHFSVIDKNGVFVKKNSKLENGIPNSWSPSAVWSGEKYGIVWFGSDGVRTSLYFNLLNRDGRKIIDNIEVGEIQNVVESPVILFDNDRYYIVWRTKSDGSFKIYFSAIDLYGKRIGDNLSYI